MAPALEGRYVVEHEPVDGGTEVYHRFEVESRGPMRLLFPLIRPFFARNFQRDLDRMVERIVEQHDVAVDSPAEA